MSMIQNQISGATKYNRHPRIFTYCQKLHPDAKQILSFGCSTGDEVRTLREIYFKNAYVDGIDINSNCITVNKNKNTDLMVNYYNSLYDIKIKYDIIFCMSVLCRWGVSIKLSNEYTFDIFNLTLTEIDKYLNKDGYLVIYNSSYIFTETEVSKKYEPIVIPGYKDSGFVYKYYKNKTLCNSYPYIIFKKIVE